LICLIILLFDWLLKKYVRNTLSRCEIVWSIEWSYTLGIWKKKLRKIYGRTWKWCLQNYIQWWTIQIVFSESN
jgi:hypothetical protein